MIDPDDDEGWPHEPDEFDPESIGPDTPSTAPSVTPEDDLVPTAPSVPDPSDADPAVARLFWKLVLVFNVAVFGLAVGPMIGYFLGRWELGFQVFLLGVLAGAYGGFRYHRFRSDRDDGDDG